VLVSCQVEHTICLFDSILIGEGKYLSIVDDRRKDNCPNAVDLKT
jgi:hypothetical protein